MKLQLGHGGGGLMISLAGAKIKTLTHEAPMEA